MRRDKNSGCCCGCSCGSLAMLVILLGACGAIFYFLSANAPEPPQANFTPDAAAADRFESKVSSSAVFGGQFTISVTEAEASSWLNLNAAAIKNADIPLENLQTRFRNNQTSLYAEWDAVGLTNIGMEVSLILGIAADGQVTVQAEEMNFGGIDLPGSIKEEFAAQIQRAIDEQLESVSSTYRVTAIRSQDGVLTIQGVVGG